MKTLLRFLGTLIGLGLAVVFMLAINLLIHEFGHCITLNVMTQGCEGVYVAPGVKVWPLENFGAPYEYEWEGYIGLTNYYPDKLAPTRWHDGLISVLGSGSTAILSLVALLALWIFQPRGWTERLLMIQALAFGDLLTYTILPGMFHLRHFFFWGGTEAEPLEGAIQMGLNGTDFMNWVLIFSGVMLIGWLGYAGYSWRRSHRNR